MKRFTLMLILLFMSIAAFPQNIVISGKVSDKHTGEELYDAHIYFPKQRKGYRSNEQGEFNLSLPAQPFYDIVISYVGYETKRISIPGTADTVINV